MVRGSLPPLPVGPDVNHVDGGNRARQARSVKRIVSTTKGSERGAGAPGSNHRVSTVRFGARRVADCQ
jgi:hypothetical protein